MGPHHKHARRSCHPPPTPQVGIFEKRPERAAEVGGRLPACCRSWRWLLPRM